jgi:arylsulfatase A-like enzyme
MGFDYFYGFVGGDASQWQPNLYRNTTAIYPFLGNPGWNLTTAMADEAIHYMKQLKEIAPDKPFFVYYVPGGTHAPHHPTPEWIKKISNMLTTAGTSCGIRSSPTRNASGSCPKAPS